jgi:hypothetical protein
MRFAVRDGSQGALTLHLFAPDDDRLASGETQEARAATTAGTEHQRKVRVDQLTTSNRPGKGVPCHAAGLAPGPAGSSTLKQQV